MSNDFNPAENAAKNGQEKAQKRKKGGCSRLTLALLAVVVLFAMHGLAKKPTTGSSEATAASAANSTQAAPEATPEAAAEISPEEKELFLSQNQGARTTEQDTPIVITCREEAKKQFVSDTAKYTPVYELAEYYHIDACLELYEAVQAKAAEEEEPAKLTAFDADRLFAIVKENNTRAFTQADSMKKSTYQELPDEEVKKICTMVIDNTKQYENNALFDKAEVLRTLSNLKIVNNEGSMSMAAVDSNDYLYVNPNMIQVLSLLNREEKETSLENTVSHEAAHLCQYRDIHADDGYRSLGISYTFDDAVVNGLSSVWLVEASAEKLSMNLTGRINDSYTGQLEYLLLLETVAALSGDNAYNCIESLSFSRDLENLYTVFGCTTEAEKREILHLLYSITVLEDAPKDFYAQYNSELTDEEKAILQGKLESSILTALTQRFYGNLLEQVVENDTVSIQDVFFLIHVFESQLYAKIRYEEPQAYARYEQFMTDYVSMQTRFFETIAGENQKSLEEITDLYSAYAVHAAAAGENTVEYDGDIYNCRLAWMEQAKIVNYGETLQFLGGRSGAPLRCVLQQRQQG